MNGRSDLDARAVQPGPTAGRESGTHRSRQPDPEVFYVRAHRRGGFCVMVDGRATPLSRHWTAEDAAQLAESLAKRSNARVINES
jgi:hypothetical protein